MKRVQFLKTLFLIVGVTMTLALGGCAGEKEESQSSQEGNVSQETETPALSTSQTKPTQATWWNPVNVKASDIEDQPSSNSPWWMIFIYGFLGGLAALITPCVWPLIPMTVSFFLKKNTWKMVVR